VKEFWVGDEVSDENGRIGLIVEMPHSTGNPDIYGVYFAFEGVRMVSFDELRYTSWIV